MIKEDIEKIISDGILAPSGENCQPWRFVVTDNKIEILNLPEADQSIYNFEQKGSYIAHGALIENISISAIKYGYIATVQVFPDPNQPNLVSTITLEQNTPFEDPLYPYLAKRCTNRKDYTGQKLSAEQKNELAKSAEQTGFGEFKIIDNNQDLKTLGQALAVNEKIIFENKELHDFFYNHILWDEEDQGKKGGFYIKTLEFLPKQLKGVKLFKSWSMLKILNKIIGVSKMIVKENTEKYAKSGSLGVIVARGSTSKDFVQAGRAVGRVWLTATKLGLAVHPCTGVLYFMENINGGNSKVFSTPHIQLIKSAYSDITRTFGVINKNIPMLMRIGFADEPSARSQRLKPEIEFKN